MRYLNNQKGIALVTALLLTLVTLAVIVGVLYLLHQQTKTSAADKVYRTALQAAYGDSEVILKDVLPLLFPSDPLKNNAYWESQFSKISLDIVSSDACINEKLHKNSTDWNTTTICPSNSKVAQASLSPDTTIILKGQYNDYKVYSKIIDTVVGNTDTSGAGGSGRYSRADGVTGSGKNNLPGMRMPYLYTVEIQAEGATNPKEKAMLEVLYAY